MDQDKCIALKRELQTQAEPQVVPLDRFFDGNDDEGSIGCNLVPHPGVPLFRDTLLGLLQRPDVTAVYALISELDPDDDSWPFTDTVLVAGTIQPEALTEALSALQPDYVAFADPDEIGQLGIEPPVVQGVTAWWD
ncbi:hypothetical protein FQY83_13870 [Luteimonas marina]|uniref:DUF4253 domain-containing protein n=2 Tax=Luteimonas TaxID=83614 RepID=A0A5C5U189_9GAMM|nr:MULTISPECIES: hypothetical protein [Luteimonas]MDH5830628.1 hypothetical protein [Luteimonas rhizosphaericola]TWT19428.1 hypothetical protein FQY83_13870 [Luteimonas marina]